MENRHRACGLASGRSWTSRCVWSRLGVDCIEAGFPASSPGDAEAVAKIAAAVQKSTVCALARCVPTDIAAAWEALREAAHPRIHVFIATSDIHLTHKLHITRDEAIRRIRECVAQAVSLCPEVQFSPEDATRTDPDFLIEALRAAEAAGAQILNIPDTVGYATPVEFGALIGRIHREIPDRRLGVHCHNDLGLAVANSLAAIEAGASSRGVYRKRAWRTGGQRGTGGDRDGIVGPAGRALCRDGSGHAGDHGNVPSGVVPVGDPGIAEQSDCRRERIHARERDPSARRDAGSGDPTRS